MLSGIARNLVIKHGIPGGRTVRTTVHTLRGIKLDSQLTCCPSRLSKNRRRQINVTHTLTIGPSIVLFSRPASTLSPRLINRILRIVHGLTRRNAAVIVIARRVAFTGRITGHIVFVSRKIVIRRNTPRTVFNGPGRTHAEKFLRQVLTHT